MDPATTKPVVHLELHTPDLEQASALYERLCGWRAAWVDAGNMPYLALQLGAGFGGGIVECGTRKALWLPYVEVADICEATDTARLLGAEVLLQPREGPAGWRSVVRGVAAGEIALWQPKR